MPVDDNEWASLREDVGYIKAKIEVVGDHEERIRLLEKRWWQFPAAAIVAAASAFFGIHGGSA